MQHEYCDEGARSKRKPTKVLKIAESFTNLDENAKAGRFIRGPYSRSGKKYRDEVRSKKTGLCSDEYVENGCDSECGAVCEGTGDRSVTGSSCTALRTAVAALYPFDDFILEKIGSGFFSEVFKVRHKTTGKVMVLKMNQQRANRPNMLREVQLMNKLKHPNILKFMGVCVHEGQLHALTEYMEGGSLESLILSQEDLSQRTKVSLAMDIADGLNYLHSCGVFHRDLTSKNVLLRKNGEKDYMAVVADFGLAAKIPDPDGCRLPSAGSPWWMSPECLRARRYDQRSDVFSFGVLLCQLLARVDADPDLLPRTDSFGLHYTAFVRLLPKDTLPKLLRLAFHCCIYDPAARPLFPEIIRRLNNILQCVDDPRLHHLEHDTSREELASGPLSCPPQATVPVYPEAKSVYNGHSDSSRRRSLSELSWSSGRNSAPPSELARVRRHPAPPTHLSATSLPHSPSSLLREAEIMLLLDPHASPHPPRNPFEPLIRGVKIFEPHSSDLFSSCIELPRTVSQLVDSQINNNNTPINTPPITRYNIPIQKSNSSIELSETNLKNLSLKRRGSCESGIFSVVNEDFCPRHHECLLGAMCPCSLLGCYRCWWWTKGNNPQNHGDPSLKMCEHCIGIYYRLLNHKNYRKLDIPTKNLPTGSANSSLFMFDDSALSTTTVSSLRSLDDLEEIHVNRDESSNQRKCDELWFASPFLCGKLDTRTDSDASSETTDQEIRSKEYHILNRCCCISRTKCLGHCLKSYDLEINTDDELGCMPSGRGQLLNHFGFTSYKRTSSVYTDSSEDVASLTGSDSLYCDDKTTKNIRSAQISKIVEYFERKGADFKYDRNFKSQRFKMGKFDMLQFGKDRAEGKDYLVDVKHRGGYGSSRLSELVGEEGCSRKCVQQRLMICEGAVKSKLPLFDKKS